MDPTPALDPADQANGDAYLDTVALLQEEIDRLEAELRAWHEAAAERPPARTDPTAEADAARRIDELTALLDERDETIALLWEHLATIEQAQAARSAEMDQLHHWLEQLEHRLGAPAHPDPDDRMAEQLRRQMEARELAWERERRALEAELDRLRARLASEAEAPDAPTSAEREREILRLRDECRRLAPFEAEAAALRDRLTRLEAQLEEAREQLRAFERDRPPHERGPVGPSPSGPAPRRFVGADLSPSERIRVLREHLREVHAREEQERKERQLSTRIARLLGRAGPRP